MTEFGAYVGPSIRLAGAATGPLAGLTFAAKDLFDIAGYVTGGGNPDWRRTHAPADRNAVVIDHLLALGASLVGRTVTDELAFSLEGRNVHDGTPVNPRDPERLPGGSSSGSAVAVAAGQVDFALGTDTGGSVRVPASFCGICGFRPTHGRIATDGVIPFAPTYDTVGWFAARGDMLARIGHALFGGQPMPPPSRLLIARDAFALMEPAALPTLEAAAHHLGAHDEIAIYAGEEALSLETYRVLQGAEIWTNLGGWIVANEPRFGDDIAARFRDAAAITPSAVAQYRPVRARIAARLRGLLGADIGIVVPSAPDISPRKTIAGTALGEFYRRALTLTSIAGHAGLPQVSLPLANRAGVPLGLSVIGAPGADEALLNLAAAVA